MTNGSELFGVGTVMPDGSRGRDGFTALSMYDSNADTVLNADDDVWTRLRIWVDRNHNGVCEPGETGPIASYGVQKIDLTPAVARWSDDAGNVHVLASSYRRREFARSDSRSGDYAIDAISFQRAP